MLPGYLNHIRVRAQRNRTRIIEMICDATREDMKTPEDTNHPEKKFADYFLHKKSLPFCVSQHRRKGTLQIGTIFHASLQNHQTNKRLHTGRQHTDTDTHTCTFFLACTPKTCTHKAMLIHIPWTVCPGAINQCIRDSLLRAHCTTSK